MRRCVLLSILLLFSLLLDAHACSDFVIALNGGNTQKSAEEVGFLRRQKKGGRKRRIALVWRLQFLAAAACSARFAFQTRTLALSLADQLKFGGNVHRVALVTSSDDAEIRFDQIRVSRRRIIVKLETSAIVDFVDARRI